jgi:hypothetical protein
MPISAETRLKLYRTMLESGSTPLFMQNLIGLTI